MSEEASAPVLSPVASPEPEVNEDVVEEVDEEITAEQIENIGQRVIELEQMVREASETKKAHELTPLEKKTADERSVYVGSVDYSTTPEELQSLFLPCGVIERVTIITDSFTKRPKGYAYVEFRDKLSVVNALELNESQLNGRAIKVITKRTNFPGMGTSRRRRRRRRRRSTHRYQPY